ncbi:MAG: FkbM family methyltransferase [Leptolyngbyaceae cyanobacterium]
MFRSLSGHFLSFLAARVEQFHQHQVQSASSSALATPAVSRQVQPSPVAIRRGIAAGLKFEADKAHANYIAGTYERPIQNILEDCLQPGAVFYDIGASLGFFTLIAAKLVESSGHVYAFEPVPENAAKIQRHAKLNGFAQVTVLATAVTDTNGRGELLLAHHAGGATLATVGTPPDYKGHLDVSLASIDHLIANQQLRPPTVVKVDVEGAEINVLRGMAQTLAAHKPVLIYEIDDGDRTAFQHKNAIVETFIRQNGYQILPLAKAYATKSWHVSHSLALPIAPA